MTVPAASDSGGGLSRFLGKARRLLSFGGSSEAKETPRPRFESQPADEGCCDVLEGNWEPAMESPVGKSEPTGTSEPAAAPQPSPEPAPKPKPAPAPAEPRKPRIAILLESPGGFGGSEGPVHVTGGLTARYGEAVEKASGTPVWMWDNGEDHSKVLEGIDGLLIPGGRDVNPDLYGQRHNRMAGLRLGPMAFDVYEIGMVRAALEKGMPIRGICRGHQILNVALNGTLMQDIKVHMDRPYPYTISHTSGNHAVVVMPNSRFLEIAGEEMFSANSYHHQAIDTLGEGLTAVARSADGIIEAV